MRNINDANIRQPFEGIWEIGWQRAIGMKMPISIAIAMTPIGTKTKRTVTGSMMRKNKNNLGIRIKINLGSEGHLSLRWFISILI